MIDFDGNRKSGPYVTKEKAWDDVEKLCGQHRRLRFVSLDGTIVGYPLELERSGYGFIKVIKTRRGMEEYYPLERLVRMEIVSNKDLEDTCWVELVKKANKSVKYMWRLVVGRIVQYYCTLLVVCTQTYRRCLLTLD